MPINQLHFRAITENDFHLLFPLWHNRELIQYTYHPYMGSLEEAQERVQKIIQRYEDIEAVTLPFLIFKGMHFIGYCGLECQSSDLAEFEIWYLIAKKEHHKGYATQAAQYLTNLAFQQLGAKSVTADVVKDNIASIKVLEKIGMIKGECHIQKFQKGLIKHDLLKYIIHKTDWLAFQKQ